MNFFERCNELFQRMSDAKDLDKDVENYNRQQYYMTNFYCVDRKIIEEFIKDVRSDNVIFSMIQQVARTVIIGPLKRLDELSLTELYNELIVERYNIVLKGAYDAIKLLNEVTPEQDNELQNKFAREDMTIFVQYKCK
ncbi:MAG: hypothetical protein NC416_06005 [Eubacterium sp.]|nr:hypothetical protein [Eubacterium sp.]